VARYLITSPTPIRLKPTYDVLIVGAGFAGSVVAERLASQANLRVLVCDVRPHIGGNAYDYYNEDGILVHKYGPHIFHTNSERIFHYLSHFTEWRPYEHRVSAEVKTSAGIKYLPVPINRTTVNELYGLNLQNDEACQAFFDSVAEPVEQCRTAEDVVVSKVGRHLYETLFRGYTRRHWGLDPSELDASVSSRIPVRTNTDDRYFGDTYQVMPLHGYTKMFEKLLAHPNITVVLETDYRALQKLVAYRELVYTGPVDAYFDYRYGKLPYLSLEFKHETLDLPEGQERTLPTPVVNFPDEASPFDRVTEFKALTGQQHPKTSIVYEIPKPNGDGDPYYPVPRPENADLYRKYKALADATPGVHFVGRLATYRYYNMDQVTAQALTLADRLIDRCVWMSPAATEKLLATAEAADETSVHCPVAVEFAVGGSPPPPEHVAHCIYCFIQGQIACAALLGVAPLGHDDASQLVEAMAGAFINASSVVPGDERGNAFYCHLGECAGCRAQFSSGVAVLLEPSLSVPDPPQGKWEALEGLTATLGSTTPRARSDFREEPEPALSSASIRRR
jgi:UDP-galactopyranose mutase